ncbi:hypothetical protein GGR88_001504 [Sphingomonas jejuensis]|uniref:Uncharacterized protein n=1 Tax=Sphingomonas jejuensis TaxID=904715 RepID=A0ABX0XLC0_9SPHN|nr:hypothetical protein [Sphingomonas jejuensis]NJC34030.1 hypothetical protein [Sphingomonas jejuensis]
MRSDLLVGAGVAAVMAAGAAALDHRRRRRAHVDAVGMVPWTGVQAAALFVAILLAALAVRAG